MGCYVAYRPSLEEAVACESDELLSGRVGREEEEALLADIVPDELEMQQLHPPEMLDLSLGLVLLIS